jgi:hypothetical protein
MSDYADWSIPLWRCSPWSGRAGRRRGSRTATARPAPASSGEPFWHYNQRPDGYDGRFNADWTWQGPGGTLVDRDTWPAGSAYPDRFMIGDPHMNFYEGKAQVDDIRLYVPR